MQMATTVPLPEALATAVPKRFRDGTDRGQEPSMTLGLALALAERAGITRVGSVTHLDRIGVPVYCAYRPRSRNLSVSQGKGLTDVAAKVSALMEALELWHAESHRIVTRFATTTELERSAATVDVMGLVRCPCNEYSADRVIRWVEGYDLIGRRPLWVPYEAVHCDWRLPTAVGEHAFQNGSNGLASGSSPVEAIVHGLCEVIERDALVAAGDEDGRADPSRRVDPESIDDPACRSVIDRFRAAGVEPIIWDVTSRAGVATFDCVVAEVDAPWYHNLPQLSGSGTHPRAAIALLRALTEAAQARLTVIAGSRDDIGPDRYAWYFDEAERDRARGPLSATAGRRFADCANADHPTFGEDLAWLLERLRAAGATAAVAVDLSLAGTGLSVVKVLVPGLQWRPWEE